MNFEATEKKIKNANKHFNLSFRNENRYNLHNIILSTHCISLFRSIDSIEFLAF